MDYSWALTRHCSAREQLTLSLVILDFDGLTEFTLINTWQVFANSWGYVKNAAMYFLLHFSYKEATVKGQFPLGLTKHLCFGL